MVIQIIHTSSTVCKLFVMSIHTNIITYSVSFINYRMQVKKRFISALKDRVSSLIFQKILLSVAWQATNVTARENIISDVDQRADKAVSV